MHKPNPPLEAYVQHLKMEGHRPARPPQSQQSGFFQAVDGKIILRKFTSHRR